ncbi:MAG TPA: winged helix-turn-helix domain-containing protein [Blastocatellia bacterium]|nr:winged helix-turn-helix domain-containing protein [Blastocatellia bacterium]
MTKQAKYNGLEFPCECVSSKTGYSDPWAGVTQNNLLPDGTKEEILNLVADEPKTVAQIAKRLNLSQPSVHRHINDMMTSELIRESDEWERKYPAERYYEPNFPVITAAERAVFEAVCEELTGRIADLFKKKHKQLEMAFNKSGLGERGWSYPEIAQYIYARVQRSARQLLEERGELSRRKSHRNGVEWLFWAEEAETKTESETSPRRL